MIRYMVTKWADHPPSSCGWGIRMALTGLGIRNSVASGLVSVRGEPLCGRDLSEHGAISWVGPTWIHIWVREIDNIVVNQDISQCNKTSLGI